MRSSTLGSNTYVPALIRLLGAVPGAGFSTKRTMRPLVVDLGDTERRWVVDRCEVDRGLGVRTPVHGDKVGDRQVGEHVAVGDDERLVDTGVVRSEADRSRGVERLRLDGVVELDATAATVGKGGDERLGAGSRAPA